MNQRISRPGMETYEDVLNSPGMLPEGGRACVHLDLTVRLIGYGRYAVECDYCPSAVVTGSLQALQLPPLIYKT